MTTAEVSESKKPPGEVTIEDFSVLVAGMSRLLGGLGRLQPFVDGDIGLAEWLTVTTLVNQDGINNKNLARSLGVSGQRVNQICSSLSSSGLISVKQSAEDNRANEITITEAGKEKINSVNAQLKPLLSGALQGKERSLVSAGRQLKHVMRVLRTGKVGKASKVAGQGDSKSAKRAKRSAREAKKAAAT